MWTPTLFQLRAACGEGLQMVTTVIGQVHPGEGGVSNRLCHNPRCRFQLASLSVTARVRSVPLKLVG